MHHLFNALAYLALALSCSAEIGTPIAQILLDHPHPAFSFKLGFLIMLGSAALFDTLHLKFGHPDHIGVLTGSFRWTSLLAFPIILLGLFHIATENGEQAVRDFDFAGFLAYLGIAFSAVDTLLPPTEPDRAP